MAWLPLTLRNGEKRLVNLRQFIFVQADGAGCYLVASDPKHSVAARESQFYNATKLDALPDARLSGDDALFRNSNA